MDSTLRDLFAGPGDEVIAEDARDTWRRSEMISAVARVAGGLRREGVRSGDRVAISMPASLGAVAALLGARAAGALCCPIDPRQPRPLDTLRPSLVIAERSLQGFRTVTLSALLSGPGSDSITDGSGAWGIATSGTTGEHKIVN
jgi:nonribosomal peptide synthetase MxcG